jgi:lipopolysaccharide/colanic/teichoic acid biosynthesis glycosyltransferase
MREGAAGPALTSADDDRFTRIGKFLALSKLDELPQLWNVLKGEMSLVGPRPEDLTFVQLHPESFREILQVKPGITGLSQLAFVREIAILDKLDTLGHYVERLLPQKIEIDRLYAARRSVWLDLRILVWTARAVLLQRSVSVHRETGALAIRRRPSVASAPRLVSVPDPEPDQVPAQVDVAQGGAQEPQPA